MFFVDRIRIPYLRIPFFRIWYSSSYTLLFILTFLVAAVSPVVQAYQLFQLGRTADIVGLCAIFVFTWVVCLGIYLRRVYRSRAALNAISRSHSALDRKNIGQAVMRMVEQHLDKCALLVWETTPREWTVNDGKQYTAKQERVAKALGTNLALTAVLNSPRTLPAGSRAPSDACSPPALAARATAPAGGGPTENSSPLQPAGSGGAPSSQLSPVSSQLSPAFRRVRIPTIPLIGKRPSGDRNKQLLEPIQTERSPPWGPIKHAGWVGKSKENMLNFCDMRVIETLPEVFEYHVLQLVPELTGNIFGFDGAGNQDDHEPEPVPKVARQPSIPLLGSIGSSLRSIRLSQHMGVVRSSNLTLPSVIHQPTVHVTSPPDPAGSAQRGLPSIRRQISGGISTRAGPSRDRDRLAWPLEASQLTDDGSSVVSVDSSIGSTSRMVDPDRKAAEWKMNCECVRQVLSLEGHKSLRSYISHLSQLGLFDFEQLAADKGSSTVGSDSSGARKGDAIVNRFLKVYGLARFSPPQVAVITDQLYEEVIELSARVIEAISTKKVSLEAIAGEIDLVDVDDSDDDPAAAANDDDLQSGYERALSSSEGAVVPRGASRPSRPTFPGAGAAADSTAGVPPGRPLSLSTTTTSMTTSSWVTASDGQGSSRFRDAVSDGARSPERGTRSPQ